MNLNGYRPVTAVWEITMGCNMRCRHCGSSCEKPGRDQLDTDEALKLCDDLADLDMDWITLSGGEPTIRDDWDLIAKRLSDNGVIPNIITNGWTFDGNLLEKAVSAGVNTIAISLDGTRETHDFIRRAGSYDRVISALDLIGKKGKGGVYSAVITTINSRNIGQLDELKEVLEGVGITTWQLQLALPMGNMKGLEELLVKPCRVFDIVDFAYETDRSSTIRIHLADCLGYYYGKEMSLRTDSSAGKGYPWHGCTAGKYSMGILHNGDILGCTSVRDRSFIEGNIRQTPVKDIWNSPDSFRWNREMDKSRLEGFCRECIYADDCLGGCSNTKLTMGGSIYAGNTYCLYGMSFQKDMDGLLDIEDPDRLLGKAGELACSNRFQAADCLLDRYMEMRQDDIRGYNLSGYVNFMAGRYQKALHANRKALQLDPADAYANKGMGICLSRLGNYIQAVRFLKKAVRLAPEGYFDPYYDLAVVNMEKGRIRKALSVLKRGRSKSERFKQASQSLYDKLTSTK